MHLTMNPPPPGTAGPMQLQESRSPHGYYDLPAADSPPVAGQGTDDGGDCNNEDSLSSRARTRIKSVSDAVKRKIRRFYRSFRHHGDAVGSSSVGDLTAEAAAAIEVAAAAAAAEAPSPLARRHDSANNNGDGTMLQQQQQQERQQQQQLQEQHNANNGHRTINPMILSAQGAQATGDGAKEDDLYSVLTVDAEELKNFYTGIYLVAECEGKRLKTKRTNRLDDIQTAFIFYRRNPAKSPISIKMFANHLTLGRRVLIGELSLTLQPGEPFDGMSVRRTIRERPELRTSGGSGLLFNFLSGMLHTQHLSGV